MASMRIRHGDGKKEVGTWWVMETAGGALEPSTFCEHPIDNGQPGNFEPRRKPQAQIEASDHGLAMTRGRYMKASHLHQTVSELVAGGHSKDTPVWHHVLHSIPPSEMLVRTRPVQLQETPPRRLSPKDTYKPQHLVYEEDALRRRFYADHPWELARPRVIAERHGTDARYYDWSNGLRQPGLPLCGESVVQRQMWLMHNYAPPAPPEAEGDASSSDVEAQGESLVESKPSEPRRLNQAAAYDMARKEFYALRQREEVEVRIQREESRMVGGTFGHSQLEAGEMLEDRAYATWVKWARKNVENIKVEREARASSNVVVDDEVPEDASTNPEEFLKGKFGDNGEAKREGQKVGKGPGQGTPTSATSAVGL
ncbi:hypothetical protein MKZ38_009830 [Zalerion maritima]|uniref:Small ribosomal subunit protein mS23 n=1 Tax=Zalerion maritima TaxID=339359 RepID=A0AAD5WVZ0_9PEZI|nr:hypothetical protein MKZ38_009830 [Zalerion maritima]